MPSLRCQCIILPKQRRQICCVEDPRQIAQFAFERCRDPSHHHQIRHALSPLDRAQVPLRTTDAPCNDGLRQLSGAPKLTQASTELHRDSARPLHVDLAPEVIVLAIWSIACAQLLGPAAGAIRAPGNIATRIGSGVPSGRGSMMRRGIVIANLLPRPRELRRRPKTSPLLRHTGRCPHPRPAAASS